MLIIYENYNFDQLHVHKYFHNFYFYIRINYGDII
jgi:hypothetical protein